ncbi:hypothetical protein BZA70DRAFT_312267 [Myxozyma melibiosi]|uniref:Uncharacterized protein n=1 Tax=Myxozyma melibiosi TaxID=54550 RepID=A0ABR1F3G8_9ASCO
MRRGLLMVMVLLITVSLLFSRRVSSPSAPQSSLPRRPSKLRDKVQVEVKPNEPDKPIANRFRFWTHSSSPSSDRSALEQLPRRRHRQLQEQLQHQPPPPPQQRQDTHPDDGSLQQPSSNDYPSYDYDNDDEDAGDWLRQRKAELTRSQPAKIAAVVIDTPPAAAAVALAMAVDQDPSLAQSTDLSQTKTRKRSLHFLLPATQLNKLVCKTLFSAALNDYPSPVLLNFNSVFRDAEEARFMKIAAIHRYLQLKVDDDDLVLIMDSYDTWFQLSFDTLLKRYYQIQEADRKAHYAKYASVVAAADAQSKGISVSSSSAPGGAAMEKRDADPFAQDQPQSEQQQQLVPPYQEQVIFGADKVCWPNARNSPACKNVPKSTLEDDIFGADTDTDPYEFKVRPRWLNSGNIIGPAKVLREIYQRAFDVQQRAKVHFSDQLILADIYGKGDLPIRIDFESFLFQTMTHSHVDVVYLYDDEIDRDDETFSSVRDPATGPATEESEIPAEYRDESLISAAFMRNASRRASDKYLAWNRVSGHCPVVLHFNGPKIALETWWNKMWWVNDQSPVHRLQRLKYARKTGGAFVDDDGTKFTTFKDMCGKFDMFEYTPSRFDQAKVFPGQAPSLDPEPFRLGMNPRKSPSDVLDELAEMKEREKAKLEKLKSDLSKLKADKEREEAAKIA